VPRARRLFTAALDDLGRAELADDAALAVSELVTNALVHAGTPMEVVVCQRNTGVLVEVVDDSPRFPFRRHHAELAGTGRGLRLVEQLTTAWGTRERPPGKSVWILLGPGEPADDRTREDSGTGANLGADLGADLEGALTGDLDADLDALLAAFPDDAGPADPAEPDEPVPEVVEVVLRQVPLLLHAAWQMQAESILREYLLARLSGDDDHVEQELETHAAVHEAMVLLQEHIPAPDLKEPLEELIAAVIEPYASAERLMVPVPAASVDHFQLMENTLDHAMELEAEGALLTPPTQPEIRAFRRWICRQVRDQGSGGTPEPWSADVDPELIRLAPEPDWDAAEVSTAPGPLIAAADTNRIMAVSPAAVRLLGYSSADELVGRRLVDIIPPRFRQAHVAGFTLHLFAGRQPLLGHRVTVPALRRDGSEVLVGLLVEMVSLPAGRRMYLAELGEAGPEPPLMTGRAAPDDRSSRPC